MVPKSYEPIFFFIAASGTIALVLFAIVGLSGASSHSAPQNTQADLVIITDVHTGCHYLARRLTGGLTPRLDRDGKQICETTAGGEI